MLPLNATQAALPPGVRDVDANDALTRDGSRAFPDKWESLRRAFRFAQ